MEGGQNSGSSGVGASSKLEKPLSREEESQSESEDLLNEGDTIENRFVVVEKLQSGSFGQVFLAVDSRKDDREVALKIEKPRPKGKRSFCAHEVNILRRCQGQKHVPELYAYSSSPPYPYIAMQLMSFTLTELRRMCPSKIVARFSLSTTLRTSIQCLAATRDLHRAGIVHRDIKPSNFMMGATEGNKNCVYILDFGLSRIFQKPNGEMVPPRDRPGFVGSTRYASSNAHDGRELGRSDDLTSLTYVIVELRVGRLPWRNVSDRVVVALMKKSAKLEKLCHDLPEKIKEFAKMIEQLRYGDDPNYDALEQMLQTAIDDNNFAANAPFDWDEKYIQVLREDGIAESELPSPSSSSTFVKVT